MLNRDFTKSNKEYFKSNRNFLIAIGVFLLVGILCFAIFGLNGNFEIKGYNEFSVNVTEKITDDFNKHKTEISNVVNSYDAKLDTVLIYGEGDNTKYVIRYLKDIDNEDVIEINKLVAEKIGVEVDAVSNHTHVGESVRSKDIIFTAVAILLLVVIATIFAYVRYNGASALAIIIACTLGTLGFLSINAILRISIGMSFFAMLVLLNMLFIYSAINLFESMHKSSWLIAGDYSTSLKTALKENKFRSLFVACGLLAIGLIFVLFAPLTIKYVSVNILFMAVMFLAVAWYVVPFAWSVFISVCRRREYKIKPTKVEDKK